MLGDSNNDELLVDMSGVQGERVIITTRASHDGRSTLRRCYDFNDEMLCSQCSEQTGFFNV